MHTFAQGKAALAAGHQIRYVGAMGPVDFNRYHNSTGAFDAVRCGINETQPVGVITAAQVAAAQVDPAMSLFVASIGFGLVTASILALAAVGFTLQFGVTNVLNLAYGSVMTATVFIAYLVAQAGAGLAVTLIAGALFGAIASAAALTGWRSPPSSAGERDCSEWLSSRSR